MTEQKKGSDGGRSKPQSTEKESVNAVHQINYSRVKKLCLVINIVGLIGFMVSYHKQAENAMFLWSGVLFTVWIIQAALYPIEEDEK